MPPLVDQNENGSRRNSSQQATTSGSFDGSADGEHSPHPPDIPELSRLLPAVFVSLEQDFLQPIEPAKDRAESLQRTQTSLDANEKAVRNNLVWMMEREARRRVNEASKTGALAEPHVPQPISWEEGDKLLNSLETPANPNQSYHLSSDVLKEFQNYGLGVGPEHMTPHERAARDLLFVVRKGAHDIEDYSTLHITKIRERLNNNLETEKKSSEMFLS